MISSDNMFVSFARSMMGSMIGGSSRISLDSIADEITEPSHTQDFSAGLTGIMLFSFVVLFSIPVASRCSTNRQPIIPVSTLLGYKGIRINGHHYGRSSTGRGW